ncbi:hypothetical protein Tco_1213560 [Tanacetum coccineum]
MGVILASLKPANPFLKDSNLSLEAASSSLDRIKPEIQVAHLNAFQEFDTATPKSIKSRMSAFLSSR